MRVQITNVSPVDLVIDINGDNNPEDKVIIHPRNTEFLTIKDSLYSQIKQTQGLVVVLINGGK